MELLFLDGGTTSVVCKFSHGNACLTAHLLFNVAITCPSGMVYQQCGPVCPKTCETMDEECSNGCVEGCFCPYGQVFYKENCIDVANCEGIDTDIDILHNYSNAYNIYSTKNVQ